MENSAPPLQLLGSRRRVGTGLRSANGRSRQSVSDDRQHHRSRPSAGRQRNTGAKDLTMGRSRGGLTTRIHLLADTLGRPFRITVTTGQVGNINQIPALLESQCCDTVKPPAEDHHPARCARTEIEPASSSASQRATTEEPFTYQALPISLSRRSGYSECRLVLEC